MRAGRPTRARRSAALLAALFLLAQFGWLPLGILAGNARYVPSWSLCGQTLCDCSPEPLCPLCDTDAPIAECERLDLGDPAPDRAPLTIVIESLLAVAPAPENLLAGLWTASPRRTDADLRPTLDSRDLGVPAPPPRA